MSPPCGTYSGYQGHIRRSETPCDPCRAAARAYMRSYRLSEKGQEQLAADRIQGRARDHALAELRRRHMAEYLRILRSFQGEEDAS